MEIDQEVVAKLTELDMIVADLERANSRVVTVERRNVSTVRSQCVPYWAHSPVFTGITPS